MIRIMILDDDEMYLKKEKDITEQYFAEKNVDCTVTIYQNVEWFLLGLNEEKFDMYILDIRMPGENGIEAAREIRRLYPDPVIIFITNFVDYAIEVGCGVVVCVFTEIFKHLSLYSQRVSEGKTSAGL